MGSQAAPPPGPTTSPTGGPATQAPQGVAKTAAETRRTAILAGYDILRPAGEVDSRAQRVLVSALVLIALCVVPEKPAAVSFGGLSFSLRHWLALAIPLCVVVVYATVELVVAWRIQWKRVNLILGGSAVSVRDLVYEELVPILTRGAAFHDEKEVIDAKRKEVKEWYEQRSKELEAEHLALEEKERYPGESFPQRTRNYDALYEERAQREQAAGISAFDKKVEQINRTGLDQDSELIRQNDQAIEEVHRLLRLKKIRLALGLVVPLTIATFSVLTFAWAVCAVIRTHHG
jgi:hypothetical protein